MSPALQHGSSVHKVLFVDDVQELVRIVLGTLRDRFRFDACVAVTSTSEARQCLQQEAYSHLISDWKMPPDNGGIELLLFAKETYPGIDCTLLSSNLLILDSHDRDRLNKARVRIRDKRSVTEPVIAQMAGIAVSEQPNPNTESHLSGSQTMNDEERIMVQNVLINRLNLDLEVKKRALAKFAEDLLQDLRQMPSLPGGKIVGPMGLHTIDDVIREIEQLTPRGVRLIELDRAALRRLADLK